MSLNRPSGISIIIPTLNEAGNIDDLVKQTEDALKQTNLALEFIFIDDHSTDQTLSNIQKIKKQNPHLSIICKTKKGKKGKSFSVIEAFKYIKFNITVMIDADLQYPPKNILPMVQALINEQADLIIANRKMKQMPIFRKLTSKLYRLFIEILFNLNLDVQSGLKVFKSEIIDRVSLNPQEWTFDLEFLLQAKNYGYSLMGYDINFKPRISGLTKVNVFHTSRQLILSAVKLRINNPNYLAFSKLLVNQKGQGFHFKGKEYITHNSFLPHEIALHNLTKNQIIFFIIILLMLIGGFIMNYHLLILILIMIMSLIYFVDLFFNLLLIHHGITNNKIIKISQKELSKIKNSQLPTYTILCPLYKESAVLPQFVRAINALDYDHSKLQVLLLLEADDKQTINAAHKLNLPHYFETIIVPFSRPRTKPKACNFGLLKATGKYIVIYDAEDKPESNQLKKAYLSFKKSSHDVVCIQGKLNFYNSKQNLLTRLFTAEYILWFSLILTGLQSIDAPIPLGGTSNHFKTQILKRKLGGWDAFNVTEDADLGMRIVKSGYRTAILDSTTYEEANSEMKNWFWQRTRWIKGYIQTYFVHSRGSHNQTWNRKKTDRILFQFIIGGKIISMLINPIMWITTISYFIFRSHVEPIIHSYYPPAVLYIAALTLIIGNFLYMYYYMIGCAFNKKYNLIRYTLLIPFYWIAMSGAAYYALFEIFYKPHYWHKTKHGLHISKLATVSTINNDNN